MNKLYRMFVDCGRMGFVDGLFITTDEELATIMNKTLYFGEILGKHSDVFFDLVPEMLTEVEIPSEAVDILLKACGRTISGYNPLDYYDPDMYEEDDEL